MEYFRVARRKLPVLRTAEELYRVLPHTFTPGVDCADFRAEPNRPALHRNYIAQRNPIIYIPWYDIRRLRI